MIDPEPVLASMRAYQVKLRAAGRLLEARAVGHCLDIIRRLAA